MNSPLGEITAGFNVGEQSGFNVSDLSGTDVGGRWFEWGCSITAETFSPLYNGYRQGRC